MVSGILSIVSLCLPMLLKLVGMGIEKKVKDGKLKADMLISYNNFVAEYEKHSTDSAKLRTEGQAQEDELAQKFKEKQNVP